MVMPEYRTITTSFPGECASCGKWIDRGAVVDYNPKTKEIFHHTCGSGGPDNSF